MYEISDQSMGRLSASIAASSDANSARKRCTIREILLILLFLFGG